MHPESRHSKPNGNDAESKSWADESLSAVSKTSGAFRVPKKSCKNTFALIEPQINPEGVHVWPFNASCPIDVLFLTEDGRHPLRMHRHEYFEVLYLCSGSAICRVQERMLPFEEGDLAILGTTLYHSIDCRTSAPIRLVALLFDPNLVRCDGGSDGTEYLAPFLLQDSEFPHVVAASAGVPSRVLELMLQVRSELPASSTRAWLAVRTYLKMLLMLLVNHYSSYTRRVEVFEQQQRAIERLRPLFQYLGENCGSEIHVGDAARMCGMRESHFMNLFRQVTGSSFIKYLNQCRIRRAQVLLVKTDRSIADISLDVGFCDQSWFGAVFRSIIGISPAAYRRRCHTRYILDEQQSGHTPRRVSARSSRATLRRPSTPRLAASARLASSSPSLRLQLSTRRLTELSAICRFPTNNNGNPLDSPD